MHFKIFHKKVMFYMLASSICKDKGVKKQISPRQFPSLHYHFFPKYIWTEFPLGLCLLKAAFLIFGNLYQRFA